MKKNNKGAVLGLVVIVAALAFSGATFKNSLVPYVPFAEARSATDTAVQIMGAPVDGTMYYASGMLHFSMQDAQGQQMAVIFKGPKPEDLDSAMKKASKITAQGTYDPRQNLFVAENLLVKCPSKYQGTNDGVERSYGKS